MKKSFIIHNDSLAVLDDLTNDQCGELFRAIKAYQLGEEITLSDVAKIAFSPFRNQFLRDDEKYKKTCEKRALAGSIGGKQKVANASKSKDDIANVADSDSKSDSKSDSEKINGRNKIDQLFEKFWQSGIRKQSKKKARPLFTNLLKKQASPEKFTEMLINDIKIRISIDQLGFTEMHPTTYLNGERWNDDKQVPSHANPQGFNHQKLSAGERVERAIAAREAQSGGHGQALDEPIGSSGQLVREPIRCDAERELDQIIDGDYTRTDN